jgi:hypothetical protein
VKYRLLLDLEVYDFLATLKSSERRQLRKRFAELLEAPARWEEFVDHDANGRLLGVTVCGRFAITFWDDVPDRHVKILRIVLADR